MDKISNAQAAEVLMDAATALREQASTINDLEQKLASRDQRDRVMKLAHVMHDKGINADVDVNALADRLEKDAAAGKLDTIEAAVDFVGPDMGTKLASINHDEPGVSSASSALEQFIVGG
jgi:two-component sensor histidine kinase